MTKEEFLLALEDVLEREEPCKADDVLDDYEEWDSLSKMAVMAYYDKNFKVELSVEDFSNMNTVSDLIKLAGENIQ